MKQRYRRKTKGKEPEHKTGYARTQNTPVY